MLQDIPPICNLLWACKMSLMQLYRPSYSQTFPKFKLFMCKTAACVEEITSLLHKSFSKVFGNVNKEIGLPLQITCLLTPRSRALLEKLTGSAASQEIPAFYGTRKFNTVFTSPRNLSLSCANSIQSPPPPTS